MTPSAPALLEAWRTHLVHGRSRSPHTVRAYLTTAARLIAATGAGIALWAATLVLVRHPALDDLVTVVGHLPFGGRLSPLLTCALARAA